MKCTWVQFATFFSGGFKGGGGEGGARPPPPPRAVPVKIFDVVKFMRKRGGKARAIVLFAVLVLSAFHL